MSNIEDYTQKGAGKKIIELCNRSSWLEYVSPTYTHEHIPKENLLKTKPHSNLNNKKLGELVRAFKRPTALRYYYLTSLLSPCVLVCSNNLHTYDQLPSSKQ